MTAHKESSGTLAPRNPRLTLNEIEPEDTTSETEVDDTGTAESVKGSDAKGTRRNSPARFAYRVGLRLIVPILIIAAWWAVASGEIWGLFVPTPVEAVQRFWDEFILGDAVTSHLVPSLIRVLLGLGLAIILGITIGVILGTSRIMTGLFQPLVHLGRSLPSPALLGVFFFLFGVGDAPKVFLITFSVIWPILLNTIDGVAAVGETRAQAARIFRIPGRLVLTHIVLPGAAPKIFAGIRTSMSYSLILMIISELQRSENGLGYMLVHAQRNFDFSSFFAVLIMLVIIGVIFNFVFKATEHRVLAWHRGATEQND